jgi:hypothetical protein
MDLDRVIKRIYPDLNAGKDFVLQDDGEGPYIAEWKVESKKPSVEELEATWSDLESQPVVIPKDRLAIIGELLVQKDIEIMEIRMQNESLGQMVVDNDIRLMMGGL